MNLKNSYIHLRGLRFHAFHGVMAEERMVGNDYEVDLRLRVNVERAMLSDDVADTVNYAEVYQLAKQVMGEPCHLVEHVAARIAQAILGKWSQVDEVNVCLTKRNPPMGADCEGAGVELCVTR